MTRFPWVGLKTLFMQRYRAGRWVCPYLPGVYVAHCGHPTALRPYYIVGPGIAENQKFRSLADAQLRAEQLATVTLTELPAEFTPDADDSPNLSLF